MSKQADPLDIMNTMEALAKGQYHVVSIESSFWQQLKCAIARQQERLAELEAKEKERDT